MAAVTVSSNSETQEGSVAPVWGNVNRTLPILFSVGLAVLSGCQGCPERRCVDQTLIQFPGGVVFDAGDYVFRITPEAEAVIVCRGTAPVSCTEDSNDPDSGANAGGLECDTPASFLNFTACETVCANPQCTVGEGQQSFDSVSFLGAPARVQVEIEKDGSPFLRSTTVMPEYTAARPNGDGCAVCQLGGAVLSF